MKSDFATHEKLNEFSGTCTSVRAVLKGAAKLKLCRPTVDVARLEQLAKPYRVSCDSKGYPQPSREQEPALEKLRDDLGEAQGEEEEALKVIEEIRKQLNERRAALATTPAPEQADAQRAITELDNRLAELQSEALSLTEHRASLEQRVKNAEKELKRSLDMEDHRDAFNQEFDAALFNSITVEDFQNFRKDQRAEACQDFGDLLNGREQEIRAKTQAAAATAPDEAHAIDILRKSSNLSTALSTAEGFIEKPGAPDAVTASLMTALGADRETQGTNAVFTLNIATLFEPMTDERLATSAAWRNLFLRATVPLEATTDENVSPAAPPDAEADSEAETDDPDDVTRFSFVLGTSLLDDSDTRLEEHRRSCFEQVVDYMPMASEEATESRIKPLREAMFDACAHEAAQEQRVALRAAVGLITDEAQQDTEWEVAAGAFVWGPTPWLYLNAIYQHVFQPTIVNTVGGGFSFGGNASRSKSGVDAWARLSLDVLWFWSHSMVTDNWVMEGRIQPTVQFRMGQSIASLGIGPRVIGGDDSNTSLMASLAVTYDADALIDPLLTQKHGLPTVP